MVELLRPISLDTCVSDTEACMELACNGSSNGRSKHMTSSMQWLSLILKFITFLLQHKCIKKFRAGDTAPRTSFKNPLCWEPIDWKKQTQGRKDATQWGTWQTRGSRRAWSSFSDDRYREGSSVKEKCMWSAHSRDSGLESSATLMETPEAGGGTRRRQWEEDVCSLAGKPWNLGPAVKTGRKMGYSGLRLFRGNV